MRPDVLVLAAGGSVGEAWMTGVLAGIEDATGIDFREVEAFVGTSAGSIVSASLAAGRSPRRPRRGAGAAPEEQAFGEGRARERPGMLAGAVRTAARMGGTVAAPVAPMALRAGAPGGALARAAVLSRVPVDGGRPLTQLRREVEGWGARFDGRLRICAVDRATGRRVVFGSPGAPSAGVAEAVEASCAVPWVFRPVRIGDRVYVDGGAWSVTNLDAAPAGRDTHVLCLSVSGGPGTGSAVGLMRAATWPAIAVETAALRRRGAHVSLVGPDGPLGANLLDPRGAPAALAAGFAQGRRLGARR